MTRSRWVAAVIVAAFAAGPMVLSDHYLILAGDVLTWAGAVCGVLFVVLYALTAPWYRSEEGAHLMAFTGYLTVVLGYIAVTTVTRVAAPSLPLPRAFVFGGLAALMIWRLSILIRAQIRHRRTPADVLPIVPPRLKETR